MFGYVADQCRFQVNEWRSYVVRGDIVRTFIMSDEAASQLSITGALTGGRTFYPTSSVNILSSLEDIKTSGTLLIQRDIKSTTADSNSLQIQTKTFKKSFQENDKKIQQNEK